MGINKESFIYWKNKYFILLGYRIWDWIGLQEYSNGTSYKIFKWFGNNFTVWGDTYYTRYEKLEDVKQQLQSSFDKMVVEGKIDEEGHWIETS
tara:strand:- start:202 stop:480 length:279 start_codon:yes stop_codon:yes gene_type:complete